MPNRIGASCSNKPVRLLSASSAADPIRMPALETSSRICDEFSFLLKNVLTYIFRKKNYWSELSDPSPTRVFFWIVRSLIRSGKNPRFFFAQTPSDPIRLASLVFVINRVIYLQSSNHTVFSHRRQAVSHIPALS